MILLCVFAAQPIRLVNGSSANEGNVEVYVNGVWGAVCDDGWDISDALVACRQLGYPSVLRVHEAAAFGNASLPFLLDDLLCDGTELVLTDCNSNTPVGQHNCQPHEIAGVRCNNNGMCFDRHFDYRNSLLYILFNN